jgi:hypothetical protein
MIIGYYTPGLYAREAERLRQSLDRLQLDCALEEIADQGDWLSNTRFKGPWLARQRRQRRGQLLYVDVDAVLHRDPWPVLSQVRGDVAVHHFRGELLSGTILLNDTAACRQLLDVWAGLCREVAQWDQRLLEQAIRQQGAAVQVVELGPEYTFVFDLMRRAHPGLEPVIEHLQASRERHTIPTPLLQSRRRRLATLRSVFHDHQEDSGQ